MENQESNKWIEHGHINREFFQKQVIFSIDADIKLKNLKNIVKGKAVYYDFLTGAHYFSISEKDADFSRVMTESKDFGFSFNRKGDIYWFSFLDDTVSNEKVVKLLKGKDLRFLEDSILFPLVLNKNGRFYYLFQYNKSVEAEVSKRLLSIQDAYTDVFGPESFKIEEITDAFDFHEFFRYSEIEEPFYEIEILIPYEGPNMKGLLKGSTIDALKSQFIVKYDNSMKTLDLTTMSEYLKLPSGSILDAFKDLAEHFVFSSYYEGICEDGWCRIRWIYESKFIPDVIDDLTRITLKGGKIILSKFFEFKPLIKEVKTKPPCAAHNHVNKEFFQKQMCFSVDYSSATNIGELIDNGIIYHDHISRTYYFILDKHSPKYPEIKMRSIRHNIEINENDFLIWFSFPEISKSKPRLNEEVENKRLFNMEGVFHYPFNIISNGRMYFVAQYSKDVEYDFTKRILYLFKSFNENLGPNSFKIEGITEPNDVIDFIKEKGISVSVIEIGLRIEYKGKDLKGMIKNIGKEPENIQFLVDEGKGPTLMNISEINQRIPFLGKIATEFFNNLVDNLSFILYADFRFTGDSYIVKMLMEERVFPIIAKGIIHVIDKGFNVVLTDYERVL